jgi:hypothetical protein
MAVGWRARKIDISICRVAARFEIVGNWYTPQSKTLITGNGAINALSVCFSLISEFVEVEGNGTLTIRAGGDPEAVAMTAIPGRVTTGRLMTLIERAKVRSDLKAVALCGVVLKDGATFFCRISTRRRAALAMPAMVGHAFGPLVRPQRSATCPIPRQDLVSTFTGPFVHKSARIATSTAMCG